MTLTKKHRINGKGRQVGHWFASKYFNKRNFKMGLTFPRGGNKYLRGK